MTKDSKAAIIAAARTEFGRKGYGDAQVERIALDARVTVDTIYANFRNKKGLFEAVFEAVHLELVTASTLAAAEHDKPVDMFVAAFDAYLDALLEPAVQRIAMVDGAEVLGFARFNALDEKYTLGALAGTIRSFSDDGQLSVNDPDNVARLMLGAVARGGMHIAASADPVRARREVGAALLEIARGIIPAG